MTGRFEVDSLRGTVVIEFGVNRWVLVSIGGDEGQSQIESRDELAACLRKRGLSEREADEFSHDAWKQRPRDAAEHVASPGEGLVKATGLSPGAALVLIVVLVTVAVLLTVYVFVLH